MSSAFLKKKSNIEPPKPGANAFHHYNYQQKLKLGDNYDYQQILDDWNELSETKKTAYQKTANATPRHRKLPGAKRSVSAYDVLRREITEPTDWKKMPKSCQNMVQMASQLRHWIIVKHPEAWGENGEVWLTTPTKTHRKIITQGIQEMAWII